ncbi:MAG TPA: PAS domain S-box protein [Steroidobacteraceae bacterium]|nr:PAS domain S-box protein [Steroidobacteraceae bacterium]HWG32026.1 PAS domain S-box protein [Steroidobacteraceae bacterium]
MLEPATRAAALVEHLTDGILILDREGIIRWVAASAQRAGLSPPELLGRPAGEALHAGDAARFQAGLEEALARPGTPVTVEGLQQGGGRAGYADDTLTFLPDTEGINGVMLVTRASSRSQPVREPLAHRGRWETEEQLRQVVRLTHIGLFDHDHLNDEVYWSPEIRRIYGWGESEPVVVVDRETSTANTWNLIHPQDRDRVAAAIKRAHAADGDGLFDVEYRIVRKDGELRWLSTRSQTLFEGEGTARHAVRTVGAVQDITAHKHVERQIELMQLSVDRCNTAIYWVSSSGAVAYANEHACRSLGMSREQLVGLHVWDFDPDFPPPVWRAAWQRVKREHFVTLQTRHRRRDGTIFPIDVLGTYIVFENEELVFVFAQDISERERAERELRLMHAAIEKSRTPFYEISPSGQIIYANEHACRSLGYTRQELIGKYTWDIDPAYPPETHPEAWEEVRKAGVLRIESSHRRKDGSYLPVEVTANYFSFKDEQYALAFAQDITERKRAERALRTSEERLQQVALVYNIGLFEHDYVTDEVYWSPELRKYWGIAPEEPVNLDSFRSDIHPDDQGLVAQNMTRAHDPQGDGRYSVQHRVIRRDNGAIRWVDTRSQTFFEGTGSQRHPLRTVGAMVDVTSRVMAEEALRHSLREKETLLREVHHRVKNNLQIIASLLHFQAKKVRDPEDLAAFAEGRNRLRSMILVHEKLYQSPDLSRIDFGSYIRALARDLQRSYLTIGRNVGVRVAADALELPIESAVPCGMILCELLTNVFKYAFPDGRSGTADVSVIASEGHLHLCVSDDGVGLPEGFDPQQSSSFGWQLIRNLTAQLGGIARVDRKDGTHVAISFPTDSGGP